MLQFAGVTAHSYYHVLLVKHCFAEIVAVKVSVFHSLKGATLMRSSLFHMDIWSYYGHKCEFV